MVRRGKPAVVLGCGLLAGCSTIRPGLGDVGYDRPHVLEVAPDQVSLLPAAKDYLQKRDDLPRAFPPSGSDGLVREDADVLYGLTLRTGTGKTQWMVHVRRLPQPQPSDERQVSVRVSWVGPFVPGGPPVPTRPGSKVVHVGADVCQLRVAEFTEALHLSLSFGPRLEKQPRHDVQAQMRAGVTALVSLISACFGSKRVSRPLLAEIINRPGFLDQLRLFLALGTSPSATDVWNATAIVHNAGFATAPIPPSWRAIATHQAIIPIDLVAGSTHMLRLKLRTALRGRGGIGSTLLSVDGFHPLDPDRGFHLWLIGAR